MADSFFVIGMPNLLYYGFWQPLMAGGNSGKQIWGDRFVFLRKMG